MRPWSLAILCLAPLAVAGAKGPPPNAQPGPPDRIESRQQDRSEPIWVAAERAVQEGQELELELFTPFERSQLQRRIEVYRQERQSGGVGSNTDPCLGARGISADYYVSDPTIADLVRFSQIVLSGTVQGGREGIYRGHPASLYRVKVDQIWKHEGSVEPGDEVFVAFQEAQIRVRGGWLCARSSRFPDRPLPGKRILIFSHEVNQGAEPIFSPMDVELFFETGTSISVPQHLIGELSSPELADIEAAVSEQALAEEGKR